jgi:quercetin dioxygenase-like cupin family protein
VTSPQPQVVDTRELAARAADLGAQWSLSGERELEANLVHIPADGSITEHVSGVDVMIVVIEGGGKVTVDAGAWALRPGVLIFVPRNQHRSVRAGGSGLTYLTVHRRLKEGLIIGPTQPVDGGD